MQTAENVRDVFRYRYCYIMLLCGASSKDAGARVTSIVEDFGIWKYKTLIDSLLKNLKLTLT